MSDSLSPDRVPAGSVYRRLLLPIYFPSLLSSTSLQALLVLVPLYVLESGNTAAFAAFLFGMRGVGMLLFDVPVGILLGRIGEKPVLVAGLVLLTASAVVFALSANPWAMSAAAMLSGMGFTAWMIGRQSYITDTSEIGERGRAIAVMAGIMRIGGIIGPVLGALVAQAYGFKVAFAILALTMSSAVLLVIVSTRNVRPQAQPGIAHLAHISGIVKSQAYTLTTAGAASIGLQLMRTGRSLLIPLFGHYLGLSISAIGLIMSLSAIVDAALFVPVGVIMDRFGRKWTGVPCLSLFALSLALLPLTYGYYSLLAVALMSGLANGLGTGLLLTLGSDLAPSQGRGEFLGIWRLIGDLGHAGGPLMIGVLIELVTLGAAAVSVAGIGMIGAIVLYRLVDETLTREKSGKT